MWRRCKLYELKLVSTEAFNFCSSFKADAEGACVHRSRKDFSTFPGERPCSHGILDCVLIRKPAIRELNSSILFCGSILPEIDLETKGGV